MKKTFLLLLLSSPVFAFQDVSVINSTNNPVNITGSVSVNSSTFTSITGTVNTNLLNGTTSYQGGSWSVSPGTGVYPISGSISNTGFNVNNTPAVSQSGTWTVSPGTGIYTVNISTTQGAFANGGIPHQLINGATTYQGGLWSVSPGTGVYTVNISTVQGAFANGGVPHQLINGATTYQAGTWVVNPGTGTYPTSQIGLWSISPGTGTYPITFGGTSQPITLPSSIISTHNSAYTTLGGGAQFGGTFDDVSTYKAITILIFSDVASAGGGVRLQWSDDGITSKFQSTYSLAANETRTFQETIRGQYFRVLYVNGGNPATNLIIRTTYHPLPIPLPLYPINFALDSDEQSLAVRNYQVGSVTVTPGTGTYTVSFSSFGTNVSDVASSQQGVWTVNPGSGTYPTSQTGLWSVSPGTGTYSTSQTGLWSVSPGSGTYVVNISTIQGSQPNGGIVTNLLNGTTVYPTTLTKGTQGSTGFTVQALDDAGRTAVVYYVMGSTVGATTVESALTFTKSSGFSATISTASPVITNGKTFRIQSIVIGTQGNSTATTQRTLFSLRLVQSGGCAVNSTLVIWQGRTSTPATSLAYDRMQENIAQGLEITAGTNTTLCASVNSTFVTNAPTADMVIIGYEY